MRGARIATIGGASLTVHPIWLAGMPLLGVLFALVPQPDPAARAALALQPLAWASCVLIHESGHALAGHALKVPVRGIALMPAGGATAFGREPRPGREELVTSLAGPAASVLLAALALLAAMMTSGAMRDGARLLALFNAGVLAANGLPALPLDGGRAVRGLFYLRSRDHTRATTLAGLAGIACGYVLGALAGVIVALRPEGLAVTLTVAAGMAWTGWILSQKGCESAGLGVRRRFSVLVLLRHRMNVTIGAETASPPARTVAVPTPFPRGIVEARAVPVDANAHGDRPRHAA